MDPYVSLNPSGGIAPAVVGRGSVPGGITPAVVGRGSVPGGITPAAEGWPTKNGSILERGRVLVGSKGWRPRRDRRAV